MMSTNLIEQLNNATSREDSHKCKLAAIELEAQAKQIEALQADAERYRWFRDNPLWRVGYRIRRLVGQEHKQWRMRYEGEPWGQWHETHERAVDAARKGNCGASAPSVELSINLFTEKNMTRTEHMQ